MAVITEKHGPASAPINVREEVHLQPDGCPTTFDDSAALKVVVQDAREFAIYWEQQQWPLRCRESDILYQSPRMLSAWEGTQVTKANVSDYMVAEHVNSVDPQITQALFYDSPPFLLRPYAGTTQDTVRAKTALFQAVLQAIDFEKEVCLGLLDMEVQGTCVFKRGWQVKKRTIKKARRKRNAPKVEMPLGPAMTVNTVESDEFERVERKVEVHLPFFERKDVGRLLVDPHCKTGDIRDAKVVIEEDWVTFRDLDRLRDNPLYWEYGDDGRPLMEADEKTPKSKIPDRETLLSYFEPPNETPNLPVRTTEDVEGGATHQARAGWKRTTEDPTLQPLKIQERWDDEKVITVLQETLVIRNAENPEGKHPYYSANWWNIRNAWHGIGLGRLVGQKQRIRQGLMNGGLDILSLELQQPLLRSRGANAPSQNIRARLGGFVDVDGDPGKAFAKAPMPEIPPALLAVMQMAEAQGEGSSGANEILMQGNLPQKGRTSMGRSATGASAMVGASVSRLQGPVGRFIRQVFVPFLADMDEMINDHMPSSQIREIIGERMSEEYAKAMDLEEFLYAPLQYEVLAGAHLAAKKAMAQSLPLMIQLFENPVLLKQLQNIGWTIDVKELFDMMMDMSEWRNTSQVVRRLTKEERAMMMQNDPGTQKVKAAVAAEGQKHDNAMERQDQKDQNRLASNLIESSIDRATGEVLRSGDRAAMGF